MRTLPTHILEELGEIVVKDAVRGNLLGFGVRGVDMTIKSVPGQNYLVLHPTQSVEQWVRWRNVGKLLDRDSSTRMVRADGLVCLRTEGTYDGHPMKIDVLFHAPERIPS